MDKEKLKFAVNFVLANVESMMLDDFIDHKWCVADWEDLRDELETRPVASERPTGFEEPIDVCADCPPVTVNGVHIPDAEPSPSLRSLAAGLDSVFSAMSRKDSEERVDGWGDDFTQFARLISEAEVAGAFTVPVLEELSEEMDLDISDIMEIVTRAQRSWDLIKKGI